jgi:gamma-glutamylaminecyclotransferase
MFVFVYGTLLSGLRNHDKLKASLFVGHGVTVDQFFFTYYSTFSYPLITYQQILKDQIKTNIIGEIYNVDNNVLELLDELEGHPYMYTREKIKVKIGIRTIDVETYIIKQTHMIEFLLGNEEMNAINESSYKKFINKLL